MIAVDIIGAVAAHTGRGVVGVTAHESVASVIIGREKHIVECAGVRGKCPLEFPGVYRFVFQVGISESYVERVGIVYHIDHVHEVGGLGVEVVTQLKYVPESEAPAFIGRGHHTESQPARSPPRCGEEIVARHKIGTSRTPVVEVLMQQRKLRRDVQVEYIVVF